MEESEYNGCNPEVEIKRKKVRESEYNQDVVNMVFGNNFFAFFITPFLGLENKISKKMGCKL